MCKNKKRIKQIKLLLFSDVQVDKSIKKSLEAIAINIRTVVHYSPIKEGTVMEKEHTGDFQGIGSILSQNDWEL